MRRGRWRWAKQARLDYKRVSDLLTNQISSQADFDKAVEQVHVAEADVKRSQAAIGEAESQVVTAEKNLAYQKERLSLHADSSVRTTGWWCGATATPAAWWCRAVRCCN